MSAAPVRPRPDELGPDAVGSAVRAYLVGALVLLESGRTAELIDSLRRRGWQRDLDLSHVHGMLLELTDHLLASALGALVLERIDEAREALERALERWGEQPPGEGS